MDDTGPETKAPPETLDFIFEYTKGAADKQLSDVVALDGKANNIFAVSSAVIALAGLTAAVTETTTVSSVGVATTSPGSAGAWVTSSLALALIAYGVVAIATLSAWRVRTFQGADFALKLWYEHWDEPVEQVKLMIVAGIPKIVKTNNALIDSKAKWISRAMVATAVEVLAVGSAVLFQTL